MTHFPIIFVQRCSPSQFVQDLLYTILNHHTTIFPSPWSYLCTFFHPHGQICPGLAQNGLENLPCPSSLLLGVLVTLLPKVTRVLIIVTTMNVSPVEQKTTSILLSTVQPSPKDYMRKITLSQFSSPAGSSFDALGSISLSSKEYNPQMVPRLMPYFLGSASAEVKSRFSNPQHLAASEELFR